MSSIVQYIQSLEDTSYDHVKEHFTNRHCRIFDSNDLYMISIPNDFSVFNDCTDEFKNAIRFAVGTILRKNTNKMVCGGFPITKELTITNPEPFSGALMASEYVDGTMIRAYYDGEKWCLSTNGSMNAYNSYWISPKSFGEMFDECLTRMYGQSTVFSSSKLATELDKDCTYLFIVTDPKVHLQNTKPSLYHVGTFNNLSLNFVNHTVDKSISVVETYTFENYSQLVELLNTNQTIQGFVFYPAEQFALQKDRYKLLNQQYVKNRKLMGNTPNMYLRYLECKADGSAVELLNTFPALKFYSSWVEKCLEVMTKQVHNLYSRKFIIKEKDVSIDFYYRPIIYELHGTFMKTQEKVTYQTVYKLLTSYHPKRINFILNGVKLIKTNDV